MELVCRMQDRRSKSRNAAMQQACHNYHYRMGEAVRRNRKLPQDYQKNRGVKSHRVVEGRRQGPPPRSFAGRSRCGASLPALIPSLGTGSTMRRRFAGSFSARRRTMALFRGPGTAPGSPSPSVRCTAARRRSLRRTSSAKACAARQRPHRWSTRACRGANW